MYKIVHAPVIPEADFALGRMNVDVGNRRIHIQVQQVGRITARGQGIIESRSNRVKDFFIPYYPAIDKAELPVGLAAAEVASSQPPP